MMRVGGRCLRGERLIGQVPHGHWKTITFVGALRCKGMTAPYVIDGAMKGKRFLDYVEHHLAPTLRRNDTVVMDNLPAHKAAGVREAIEARGAVLRYLPQYSPDFNPIEMPFSKLKAYLRKMAERTIPRLRRRIRTFARNLTAREAKNYFKARRLCLKSSGICSSVEGIPRQARRDAQAAKAVGPQAQPRPAGD